MRAVTIAIIIVAIDAVGAVGAAAVAVAACDIAVRFEINSNGNTILGLNRFFFSSSL